MSDLIIKDSIEELCAHRARAIELYASVVPILIEARQAHHRAATGRKCIASPDFDDLKGITERGAEAWISDVRKRIDGDMWRAFMVNTKLGGLMDAQAIKEFEKSLEGDVPEATPETIFATLTHMRDQGPAIFSRGLVNAFSKLCRDYKSNNGFSIGPRIVITYAFSTYGVGIKELGSFNKYAELRDIDRVMHILDGKPAPEDHNSGLVGVIQEAADVRPRRGNTIETPYFRARWFLNGNMHLYVLRDDLREKANKIIAAHYGLTLGAGHDVAEKSGPRPQEHHHNEESFFGTPHDLAKRMCRELPAKPRWDEPPIKILEPSAGLGGIAVVLHREKDIIADCIERHPVRFARLQEAMPKEAHLRCDDFLTMDPTPIYDAVIMNPPFGKNADAYHVLHALNFLKPGGRLVAVMSASLANRKDQAGAIVRQRIASWGGKIEPLPAGSFAESGTLVGTVLVTMNRPGYAQAAAA